MITRIYGASDDLIEIDGQISDEIDAYSASISSLICPSISIKS